MVADFVAGGGDASGDVRQALHVLTAHEEGGRNFVMRQNLQERRSRLTRPVVEGECDGGVIPIPVMDRGSENAGGSAAHGVS